MLKLHSSRILKAKFEILNKLFTNINKYDDILNGKTNKDYNI